MNLLLAAVLVTTMGASEIFIEAEDAELFGVTIESTQGGYSGAGYVTGFDAPEDSLRFQFDAAEGVYELAIASAQSGRFASYTLWIDGVLHEGTLIGGGNFVERPLMEIWLPEGTHTIVFQAPVQVDYLRLIPAEYEPPSVPDVQLSDPDATPATQALFAFLKDTYGDHILAGQQELREVDYIVSTTGKEPAVAGGDLIAYSPSRWERGDRPRRSSYAPVEELIDWADQDGIVALMWHWNAPTDLLDTADQPWWRGFYTEATTFDFAAALADPNSEDYQLLLRDIDAIADQLQKFADADVPLLWRPLHEAAGGWFWWGSKGPEPFVDLWHLLYDRLVNYHGFHNLIWVYTHQPDAFAWYPGDAYVDIVGSDVYADDPRSTMRSIWQQMQETYGDRKLVALTESGTLPPPEVTTGFGVWWNWFAIWSDSFIRDIDTAYLQEVYASEVVMTRDELPDWRGFPVGTEPIASLPTPELALYPNPSTGPATLRLTLSDAADVRVEVYDALGRRVRTQVLGYQAPGEIATTVEGGLAAGVYFVRVVAGELLANRKLVVVR